MTDTKNADIRQRITDTLQQLEKQADFNAATTDLLRVLGYESSRTIEGLSGTPESFCELLPSSNTKTEKEFIGQVKNAKIIFQYSAEEIDQQRLLLGDEHKFDKYDKRSFFFASIELHEHASRSKYAQHTREVSKRFAAPVIVLFRAPRKKGIPHLTIAFADRRPHKTNPNRDVLGKVSLIHEIDCHKPHRGHLDILAELSLNDRLRWIGTERKQHNFEGLHRAWLAVLDTEELNKRFYQDLREWYKRALGAVKFPHPTSKTKQATEEQNKEHIIRMISRLLFIWFIKEKGLVAEQLFNEPDIKTVLKDCSQEGDSYYRAVLQNLFFATLNTEISAREFSKRDNDDHRNFALRRYKNLMSDDDTLVGWLDQTPFVNGGLFECLDGFDSYTNEGGRIDCFTDNDEHRLLISVPNSLFFGSEGLLHIFKKYKFTIQESTPIEQEVALDPELLGKVFEQLLGHVNEQRKQTGSYYTPRPIVEYMVSEAIIAHLMQRVKPTDGDTKDLEDRLRYLLDYTGDDDADELIYPEERDAILTAIRELKILDPAVGSGAFVVGALQQLVLILERLDPTNEYLKKRELARTEDMEDRQSQEQARIAVEQVFSKENQYNNYWRKLAIIRGAIFGVDIQPTAIQITKLRFFISLTIEQRTNTDSAKNYGIRPLPNLETKFVIANTLTRLKQMQGNLRSHAVVSIEEDIHTFMLRYFSEVVRKKKLAIHYTITELRQHLKAELIREGLDPDDAKKIADWDFQDQTTSADWFDPEFMFGAQSGFDIVIGNPPYKQVARSGYSTEQFPYSQGKDKGKQNLYKLFVERSYNLAKVDIGIATMIVPSSLLCDLSSAGTRRLLLDQATLKYVIEFPEQAKDKKGQVFQSVVQGTCIYQFIKTRSTGEPIRISIKNDALTLTNTEFASISATQINQLYPELHCIPLIKKGYMSILDKIYRNPVIKPFKQFIISTSQGDLNLTIDKDQFSTSSTAVRLVRGMHITPFRIKHQEITEYCIAGFKDEEVNANTENHYLISQQVAGTMNPKRLICALNHQLPVKVLYGNSTNKIFPKEQGRSKFFLGLLNSKFMDWFFRITSTNNHVMGYQLERLPIPEITPQNHTITKKIEQLADEIIAAKASDAKADTHQAESEIDTLVYQLYNLTPAEIAIINGEDQ